MARPLLRGLRCGQFPLTGRPLAWRAAATVAEPPWRRGLLPEAPQWHGHWAAASWVAGGAVVLALAESRRRKSLSCSSLKRVALGKADEYEESSMREVLLGPEGKASVLVHRHGGVFFVTSSECSDCGTLLKNGISASGGRGGEPTVSSLRDATFSLKTGIPVRGPALNGIATYKADLVDGKIYAYLPTELVDGTGKHKQVPQTMVKRDPKDKRVFLLIGGGAASNAAAETLRQEGFRGRIVMITEEAHLPYDRAALSKNLDKTVEELRLRPVDFYDKWDIEVMHNTTVSGLDAKAQQAFCKADAGKEQVLSYDRVLVASGGLPRKLCCPGATLSGIHTLRTQADAAEITKFAKKGQKMIVVGGSLIGMEIASSLRKKGCEVAMIAMETVPFERVLGRKVGSAFARLLQKEGIQWYGSAQVRHFRGNDCVNGVELEDGEVLPADCVVVGAGILPNTNFVSGTLLDENGGIVVGPLLNSKEAPTLFAAGDVCSYPSVRTGTQVRLEHWDVATQQGRVAARNMLDQYHPFTTLPFFCSSLFGRSLRFVGHAPDVLNQTIIEGDVSGSMEFISYYTEGDEVMAVATVNKDQIAVACAELMRRGKMPKVSELMLGVVNAEVILQRLKDLKEPAPAV